MLLKSAGQLGFYGRDLRRQFDDDTQERTHNDAMCSCHFRCGLQLGRPQCRLDLVGSSSHSTLTTTRPQQPLDRAAAQSATHCRRRCVTEHSDGVTAVQIGPKRKQCRGIELPQRTAQSIQMALTSQIRR